jgi:hypothetical protein
MLVAVPLERSYNVGLLGIPTHMTSLTPRSSTSTPEAICEALGRNSNRSFSDDEMRRFGRIFSSGSAVCAIDITEIDVERHSDDQRTVRLGPLLVLEVLASVCRRTL